MVDAILSAPPVLKAIHSYWPAFSEVICQTVRREPSVMSVIAYCPLLDPEITRRPSQRQLIAGRGVPLARQSMKTSDPDSTCKLSPIWMETFVVLLTDSIELFPDWIWALLSPAEVISKLVLRACPFDKRILSISILVCHCIDSGIYTSY